jgi:23S rRNA (uridine2552-2'-O)-methyltransferase
MAVGSGRRGGGSPSAGSGRALTVTLKKSAKRSVASQRWLTRQLNDPYVKAAQDQGWRSRAAFKLIELDDRFHILGAGARVLDLGAAPGGWTQVALDRGAAAVVGIDLLAIEPITGAHLIQGDATEPEHQARILELLGGRPTVVLSDMAPNTSGHAATDHIRIVTLAELALELAFEMLEPGGAFVTKLFQGGAEKHLLEPLKRRFATVRHAKPPASRKESSELYVVATGFRQG